jgi:hypothetical protein
MITDAWNVEIASHMDVNQESGQLDTFYGRNGPALFGHICIRTTYQIKVILKVKLEFKLPVPSVVPIIAPIVASNEVPFVVPM